MAKSPAATKVRLDAVHNNCTHYIYGEGEKEYLDVSLSRITFIDREKTDLPNYAWLG